MCKLRLQIILQKNKKRVFVYIKMAGSDYGLTVIGGSDNNLITVYREEFRRLYAL